MRIRPRRCRSCHERAQIRRVRERTRRFVEAVYTFSINASEVALHMGRATWAIRGLCLRVFIMGLRRPTRRLLVANVEEGR